MWCYIKIRLTWIRSGINFKLLLIYTSHVPFLLSLFNPQLSSTSQPNITFSENLPWPRRSGQISLSVALLTFCIFPFPSAITYLCAYLIVCLPLLTIRSMKMVHSTGLRNMCLKNYFNKLIFPRYLINHFRYFIYLCPYTAKKTKAETLK